MKRVSILLLVSLAALAFAAGPESADPDSTETVEGASEGRRLYEFYCVNCHGWSGTGDGPTAKVLTVPPADLTTLANGNGGEFPADRVAAAIDGRERNAAHGSRMPIWGLGFQDPGSDLDQEKQVKRRIDALTEYLESIQVD